MTTTDNTEIWVLTQQALHAYADQLRREAAGRRWGGSQHKDHRALLRAQAKLALVIEQSVSNISPRHLASFLTAAPTWRDEKPEPPREPFTGNLPLAGNPYPMV